MGYSVGINEKNQVDNNDPHTTVPINNTELPKVIESLNISLGIETLGDTMGWILDQGTPIPVSGSQIFTNAVAQQSSVKICVKQGSSEHASENVTLYTTFLAITPMPAPHTSKISVTFKMDDSMMLSMTAYDTSIPEKAHSYTLQLQGRIDDDNINRLASGDITATKEVSPTEAKLKELTSRFYKTCSSVQSSGNVLVRKSHTPSLSVVQSFVYDARGDSISVDDIKRMNELLDAIDSKMNPSSPVGSPVQSLKIGARPRAGSNPPLAGLPLPGIGGQMPKLRASGSFPRPNSLSPPK